MGSRSIHYALPAVYTWPKINSDTSVGFTFALFSASSTATFPSWVAGKLLKLPLKDPIGVRAAPTITTVSSILNNTPKSNSNDLFWENVLKYTEMEDNQWAVGLAGAARLFVKEITWI